MVHGFHVTGIDIGPVKTHFQVTLIITFFKLSFVHIALIAVYAKGGKCQNLDPN